MQKPVIQRGANKQFITKTEADSIITNKKDYWEALVRNQYYLPKYSSTCTTIDYLQKVRAGRFWVPKCPQINHLPCPNPPTLLEVMGELYAAA